MRFIRSRWAIPVAIALSFAVLAVAVLFAPHLWSVANTWFAPVPDSLWHG